MVILLKNGKGDIDVDQDKEILVSQSNISTGGIQFALETNDNITWWKGIKIFDVHNNMISLLAMQDQDHGPDNSKVFNLSQFGDKIRVEIWKAKLFGVHTCMKTVYFDRDECNGKKTLFFWNVD